MMLVDKKIADRPRQEEKFKTEFFCFPPKWDEPLLFDDQVRSTCQFSRGNGNVRP
jgi:hypothetical protein